jgi:haloalkane dehalogenase
VPWLGEILVKRFHLFVRVFMFRAGIVHRERLTRQVRRAYLRPHPTWSSRTAVLVFPRQISIDGKGPVAELTTHLERGLEQHFRSKPVRIMWGMRDPAFTPSMLDHLWLHTFPDAEVTRLEDAGHFLQEDAHDRIVPELLRFLADLP